MPGFFVVSLAACVAPGGRTELEGSALAARVLSPGCPRSRYGTVQAAIDDAAPGAVIEVCAGTYPERLEVTKDLTLRSAAGAAATTIDAAGMGRALTVSGGAHVVVEDLTFRGGTNAGAGGNVRCELAELELRDSVLVEGDAFQGGGAGLVRCEGVVEGNTFRGNHATFAGGGLYVLGDAAVRGNTFEENAADSYGGAAYVEQGWGEIAGNVVLRNISWDDGGGIYVQAGAPIVEGNTFEENDTSDEGGGLRVKLAEATIRGNTFTANHADYRGGAMKVSHDEVVMEDNTYVGNSSWVAGGAVLMYESASVVRRERFVDNSAGDSGGALFVTEGWGGVSFEDCTFDGNTADEGGHVYVFLDEGHTTTFRRATFLGGAAGRGGALYATASDLRVENSLFASNVADVSGGAMYLSAVTGGITNAVVAENEAPEGAALRFKDGQPGFDIANSAFVGNEDGPAIDLSEGEEPAIRYCAFDDNDDDVSGLDDPIGRDGNLDDEPGFLDPAAGEYGLEADSALRDAGDPTVRDRDGTRCDIGLDGGPGA